MPLLSSRSLSEAGIKPPAADDVTDTADSAPHAEASAQPPRETTAEAPAPSSPKVLALKGASVTAVSTIGQLRRAVAQAALDIEIHAHLDLRPLLEEVRAETVSDSPDLVRDREAALDALAMLELNVQTRSIRVRCRSAQFSTATCMNSLFRRERWRES